MSIAMPWWVKVFAVVVAIVYLLLYLFTMLSLKKKKHGIHWYRLLCHAFYVLPIITLAGYFYPPHSTFMQYSYIAIWVLASLASLAMTVEAFVRWWPKSTKNSMWAEPEPEQSKQGGILAHVLMGLIAYAPSWIACLLGSYIAWPLMQQLIRG